MMILHFASSNILWNASKDARDACKASTEKDDSDSSIHIDTRSRYPLQEHNKDEAGNSSETEHTFIFTKGPSLFKTSSQGFPYRALQSVKCS